MYSQMIVNTDEPSHEKTNNVGFHLGLTQTKLYSQTVTEAGQMLLPMHVVSSPEPSGSQGELIVYPCSVVRPSVVHHFQRSSALKPLGQSKPNFT